MINFATINPQFNMTTTESEAYSNPVRLSVATRENNAAAGPSSAPLDERERLLRARRSNELVRRKGEKWADKLMEETVDRDTFKRAVSRCLDVFVLAVCIQTSSGWARKQDLYRPVRSGAEVDDCVGPFFSAPSPFLCPIYLYRPELIAATVHHIPTIHRNHFRATSQQHMFLPSLRTSTSGPLQSSEEIQDLNTQSINH